MPYKSQAQRRFFNANRKQLEAEGVDVEHWNKSSKGKKMPEKVSEKSPAKKQADEVAKKLASLQKQVQGRNTLIKIARTLAAKQAEDGFGQLFNNEPGGQKAASGPLLDKLKAGASEALGIGAEMGNSAMSSVADYLKAPSAHDLAMAQAEGLRAAADQAAGRASQISLSPSEANSYWPSRLLERAKTKIGQNKKEIALVGAGAAGSVLLNRYLAHRKRKKQEAYLMAQLAKQGGMHGKFDAGHDSQNGKQKKLLWGSNTVKTPKPRMAADKSSEKTVKLAAVEDIRKYFEGLLGSAASNSGVLGLAAKSKAKELFGRIKAGVENPETRTAYLAALGAAGGGSTAMLAELFSGRRRKRYLRSGIQGALGGALLGGAGGYVSQALRSPNSASEGPPKSAAPIDTSSLIARAKSILNMPVEQQDAAMKELNDKINQAQWKERAGQVGGVVGGAASAVMGSPTASTLTGAAGGYGAGAVTDRLLLKRDLSEALADAKRKLSLSEKALAAQVKAKDLAQNSFRRGNIGLDDFKAVDVGAHQKAVDMAKKHLDDLAAGGTKYMAAQRNPFVGARRRAMGTGAGAALGIAPHLLSALWGGYEKARDTVGDSPILVSPTARALGRGVSILPDVLKADVDYSDVVGPGPAIPYSRSMRNF